MLALWNIFLFAQLMKFGGSTAGHSNRRLKNSETLESFLNGTTPTLNDNFVVESKLTSLNRVFDTTVKSAHLNKSGFIEKEETAIQNDILLRHNASRRPKWPEFFCRDQKNRFTFQDMCDGHKHCDDGTDECDSMCKQTFKCTSDKKCLSLDQFCDGVRDCTDASDETAADDDDTSESFSCINHWVLDKFKKQKYKKKTRHRGVGKRCRLPGELLCDGINHCGDHSDECNDKCTNETRFICGNGNCIASKDRCDGHDDCGDGSDECIGCKQTFHCDDRNETCIPQASFCDDKIDCPDGSDELTEIAGPGYAKEVFCANLQNPSEKKCFLPDRYVCDGYEHCYDREDECVTGCNSFTCDNRNCILIHQNCDGFDDCGDMSDECQAGCNKTFQCDDGQCLSIDHFCDGVKDCSDGSDEIINDHREFSDAEDEEFYCSNILDLSGRDCKLPLRHLCDGVDHCRNRTDECQSGCNHSYFCDKGSNCIKRESVCNGEVDCRDESDEVRFSKTFPAIRGFICKVRRGIPPAVRTCVLPQELVLDETPDCEGERDVCWANTAGTDEAEKELKTTCIRCLSDGNFTISRKQLCNGVFDCPDLSDECLCHDSNASQICSQICFKKDLGPQCPCPVGQIPCVTPHNIHKVSLTTEVDTLQCVNISRLCDGQHDCANQADEMYCGRNKECSNSEHSSPTRSKHNSNNASVEAHNLRSSRPNQNCTPNYICPRYQIGNTWTPKEAIECNGVPECFDLDDECSGKCAEEYHFCKRRNFDGLFSCPGGAIIAGIKVCDGEVDCGNSTADEDKCPNRFYCTTPGPIFSIPQYLVCDLHSDCLDESDEIGCNDTHFYCEGKNANPLYVSKRSTFDGKDDCHDGSDECPSTFSDVVLFSSKEKLIESSFLNGMVWVMGILSVIGNTSVFVYTFRSSRENKNRMSNISVIYNFLVMNLAVADLIMGLFLLILGAQTISVSGSYCRQDKIWRSGTTCSVLGIMSAISSETSIAMLAILSSYRLSCVARPIKSREFQLKTAVVIASSAWIISVVLATVPMLPMLANYFVAHVWLSPNPYFGADVVQRENINVFMKIMDSYLPDNRSIEASQNFFGGRLEGRLVQLHQHYKILGYFGYYSTHGVCLSKIFVSRGEPAWEYSFVITTMNFLIFIYIVVAYALMWRPGTLTKSTTKVSRAGKSTRNMQRRIAVLVASNFACWMPTCMIAFLRLAGVDIANTVYALAAIILFPINSALNPILYSNAIQRIIASVRPFVICCRRGMKRSYSGSGAPRAIVSRGKNVAPNKNADHLSPKIQFQAIQRVANDEENDDASL